MDRVAGYGGMHGGVTYDPTSRRPATRSVFGWEPRSLKDQELAPPVSLTSPVGSNASSYALPRFAKGVCPPSEGPAEWLSQAERPGPALRTTGDKPGSEKRRRRVKPRIIGSM